MVAKHRVGTSSGWARGVTAGCVTFVVCSTPCARAQGNDTSSDPSNRTALRTALDAFLPTVSVCNARLTAKEKVSGGRVIVAFVIVANGGVANVHIIEKGRGQGNISTLTSESVRACVREQVETWAFPRARFVKEKPPRVNVEVPVSFPVK